jgi:hypothetical protein
LGLVGAYQLEVHRLIIGEVDGVGTECPYV